MRISVCLSVLPYMSKILYLSRNVITKSFHILCINEVIFDPNLFLNDISNELYVVASVVEQGPRNDVKLIGSNNQEY